MVQIFISHNIRDRQRCEWLKASAEELGITAYLAEHDVQPGTNLAQKVSRALDASEAVVALITTNSVESPYVHQEIGYAIKADKLIIPLVQPGIPLERLAMLQGIECIRFDFEAPHEGHAELMTALRRLVQHQAEKAARAQRDVLLLALGCLVLLIVTSES